MFRFIFDQCLIIWHLISNHFKYPRTGVDESVKIGQSACSHCACRLLLLTHRINNMFYISFTKNSALSTPLFVTRILISSGDFSFLYLILSNLNYFQVLVGTSAGSRQYDAGCNNAVHWLIAEHAMTNLATQPIRRGKSYSISQYPDVRKQYLIISDFVTI